jgi:hypothetical protein
VDLRAGLDTEDREKILLPLPGIEPRSPGRSARSQTLYCLSYPAPMSNTKCNETVVYLHLTLLYIYIYIYKVTNTNSKCRSNVGCSRKTLILHNFQMQMP